MHTTKWILGLVVTLAGVGLSREARADVKFCNQTGQSVMVELAYMNSACFASGGSSRTPAPRGPAPTASSCGTSTA